MGTYHLLRKIVWEVSDHDLVLGWDAIGWRTTLTALTGNTRSLGLLRFLGLLGLSSWGSGFGQRQDLRVRNLSTFLTLRL